MPSGSAHPSLHPAPMKPDRETPRKRIRRARGEPCSRPHSCVALGFRRGAKVGTPRSRYVGLAEGKSAGRTGASGSLSNRSPSICWAVHSIVQGASESERGVCAVLEAGLVPALEGGARLRLPAPDAADGGWESPGLGVRAPGAARPRARSWVLGEGLRPGSQGRLLPGSHRAKKRRALSGVSSYKAPVPC